MKRRVDDSIGKQENSVSGAYTGSNTPIVSAHTTTSARIISTAHAVNKLGPTSGVAAGFSIKTIQDREVMPSSVQYPPTFGSAMPGAAASGATVKTASSGLQGGAPAALQSQAHQQHNIHSSQAHHQLRHKVHIAGSQNVPPGSAVVPVSAAAASTVPTSAAATAAAAAVAAAASTLSTSPNQQQQQQPHQFQRLKVEDALSYLDQVKFKFGTQPQVYNDFLDIMKEFKSQSIDTPGVIQRVSNLFKGHPELIVGFNTFLPPGYKIEVQAGEQGHGFQVSVSMPSPTATTTLVHTTQTPGVAGLHSLSSPTTASSVTTTNLTVTNITTIPGGPPTSAAAPKPPGYGTGSLVTSASGAASGGIHSHPSAHHPFNNTSNTNLANNHHTNSHHSVAAHHAISQAHQALTQSETGGPVVHPTPQSQPVEFNHAINYVNKIKNRFQGQPDKYKRFLEILHTYQKEQRNLKEGVIPSGKHLTEAEVYSQVAKLFENQDDLLAEFGQFLPDATSGHHSGGNKSSNTDHISPGIKKCGIGGKPGNTPGSERASSGTVPYNNCTPDRNILSSVDRGGTGSGSGSGSGGLERTGTAVSNLSTNDRERSLGADRERGSTANERSTSDRAGNDRSSVVTVERGSSSIAHSHTGSGNKMGHTGGQVKRSPSSSSVSAPPAKKHKSTSLRDITLSEASKYANLTEYYFFDKVKKALKSSDVYENFLRCLMVFNHEVVSKSELVQLIKPFLGKFPELFRWFKEFLLNSDSFLTTAIGGASGGNSNMANSGIGSGISITGTVGGGTGSGSANCTTSGFGTHHGTAHHSISGTGGSGGSGNAHNLTEPLQNNIARQDRQVGDHAVEIDYTTCKRLGASYCALPKNYAQPKCSGRTQLCREVLNDTWVSFPTWSEDSTFVTSRKTQFEELIYRCEDERFELDVVIETNAVAIHTLEVVNKKMSRLLPDELLKFRLDDALGGTSATIQQRAIRRIYGDKAPDIIEGLKKNPGVAVPVVLRRLKAKEDEWREAQKGFNKIWRDQNEKYYLKSLDHQGNNFKQSDVKALRSKSLFNEIETIFDERHEQSEEGSGDLQLGPHLVLSFKDKNILEDAANLIIHHVKRQTSIHKEDKQRIKMLLRQFLPDMFFHPRQELSEDERDDDDDDKEDVDMESGGGNATSIGNHKKSENSISTNIKKENNENESGGIKTNNECDGEYYRLFFGNNHWYLFLRLHHILCERLSKMYVRAMAIAEEEAKYRKDRKESIAVTLRLKSKSDVEVEDYYPAFLEMVKNVLDGNLDSGAYEDQLREMLGIRAYIAFTLDKVVTSAVRQLQHLVTDEPCTECTDLFIQEFKKPAHLSGAGGPISNSRLRHAAELAYQKRAEQILHLENCFKINVFKNECKLTIELLETENEEQESVADTSGKWSKFVEGYSSGNGNAGGASNSNAASGSASATPRHGSGGGGGGDASNEELDELDPTHLHRSRKPVYLLRNVRPWKRNRTNSSRPNRASNSPSLNHKSPHSSHGGDCTPCSNADHETNLINNESGEDEEQRRIKRFKKNSCEGSCEEDSVKKESDRWHLDESCSNADTSQARLSPKLEIHDTTECRFNINSFRMVFVVNKENLLYRQQALSRARESHCRVSLTLSSKFRRWHQRWIKVHLTEEHHLRCHNWLMGIGDGLCVHRTRIHNDNDLNRAPYQTYNRYRVEYPKSTPSLTPSTTTTTLSTTSTTLRSSTPPTSSAAQ